MRLIAGSFQTQFFFHEGKLRVLNADTKHAGGGGGVMRRAFLHVYDYCSNRDLEKFGAWVPGNPWGWGDNLGPIWVPPNLNFFELS